MVPSIDLDRTASSVYYVRLDSRAASEVNGVKTLEVNNLVKATEVSYYRKDNWDQCKFEDPDHKMVTTMLLIVRLDYISVDHKLEEESQVEQWVDNISVDHQGEMY